MIGDSKLKVLKVIMDGTSHPIKISFKTGITNSDTNIICKGLVKKGLLKKNSKEYTLTPKGKKALDDRNNL